MLRLSFLLSAIAALATVQPALAQQTFENLDRIDSLVAMTVGADMGEPGGPAAPVDRRLRLAACPTTPTVEGPVFGAAMDVGDLDGDGCDELVVGARGADVDGVGGAGAIWVFRGAAALTDLTDDVVVLRHPRPNTGDGLGWSLALAPSVPVPGVAPRFEVAAGAPGRDAAYVFLCSGLDGDDPATTSGERCQPR